MEEGSDIWTTRRNARALTFMAGAIAASSLLLSNSRERLKILLGDDGVRSDCDQEYVYRIIYLITSINNRLATCDAAKMLKTKLKKHRRPDR